MKSLLSVRNLTVEFITDHGWVKVVEDVSFEVRHKEALGIVGESGSGKSVTALAIMGLLPPAARVVSGSIMFGHVDLLSLSRHHLNRLRGNELAMVFQEPLTSMNPAFTIGDQVAETIRRHRQVTRRAAWKEAVALLDTVGIPSPAKRARDYPHTFSGGMRQRAMLAAALACRPKLLIADEPTTALDMTVQALVLDLIKDLHDEYEMGLVLITHDLGVVAETCDRAMVMYSGQVVESGPGELMFRKPAHPYTEGLLMSIPSVGAKGKRLWSIPGVVPPPWDVPSGCRFHPRCPYSEANLCAAEPIELVTERHRECRCVRSKDLTLKGAGS